MNISYMCRGALPNKVRAAHSPVSSIGSQPVPQQPGGLIGWFISWVSDWGQLVINAIMAIGDFSLFAVRTFTWMVSRLPRRETVWPNFYQVGVSSLPVVALTGTFIGMVLAVQSYFQFRQIGLETRLGGVINMTLVRELGPVLAATMLAGRSKLTLCQRWVPTRFGISSCRGFWPVCF